jgi:hypothetical protein
VRGKQIAAYAGCIAVAAACAATGYDALFPSSPTASEETTVGRADPVVTQTNAAAHWPTDPSKAAIPYYDETVRLALAPPGAGSDDQYAPAAPPDSSREAPTATPSEAPAPIPPQTPNVSLPPQTPNVSSSNGNSQTQSKASGQSPANGYRANDSRLRRKSADRERGGVEPAAPRETRQQTRIDHRGNEGAGWARSRRTPTVAHRDRDDDTSSRRNRDDAGFAHRDLDNGFASRDRDEDRFVNRDHDNYSFAHREDNFGRGDRYNDSFTQRDRHDDSYSRRGRDAVARGERDREGRSRLERGVREVDDPGPRRPSGLLWGTFFWR